MSSKGKVVVRALITGGAASGGPPIGPAVGPTGINIKDVVDAVNEKTMSFKGLTVPVRIECDPETKQFTIFVETPSTASLLLKEAGAEKGSASCLTEKIGNITIELKSDQIYKSFIENSPIFFYWNYSDGVLLK